MAIDHVLHFDEKNIKDMGRIYPAAVLMASMIYDIIGRKEIRKETCEAQHRKNSRE